MAELYLRKSFKYVDSCSSMDKWEHVGKYSVDHSCNVDVSYDEYEGYINYFSVKVESDRSEEDIKAALKHEFTEWGCHHDYDCCGCLLKHVTHVLKLYDNEYLIRQGVSRNY